MLASMFYVWSVSQLQQHLPMVNIIIALETTTYETSCYPSLISKNGVG